MEKFLVRTRSEEAKESWRSLLGAYTLPQLEKTYADALLSQESFVANCKSGRLGEGAYLDHQAYVSRFPGIPGEIAFEDANLRQLAIAANTSQPAPLLSAVALASPETLPTDLPLTEGMEVYVDGLEGAVVVTRDADITPHLAKVHVQTRGRELREVKVSRCKIVKTGKYPYPGCLGLKTTCALHSRGSARRACRSQSPSH